MTEGRWKKLGLIFEPPGSHPKLLSHAANPVAVPLSGDRYRVYYSGRDARNRSSVGYFDFDLAREAVEDVGDGPAFEHGLRGSFYADGVSVGCWYEETGGERYMLFMGWQTNADDHWRGDIGRLLIGADGELRLDGGAPLMASDATDPISLSYPWVLAMPDRGWRMWYGSTVTWDAGNGEMLHVINHATSTDGSTWRRDGLAVPFKIGTAQAFSRPSVIAEDDGTYRMWFSYRGAGGRYRIGSARSTDGRAWSLALEEAGIDVSASGWDSEMIEYPFVFCHGSELFMMYNGNNFGRSGIGLAVFQP